MKMQTWRSSLAILGLLMANMGSQAHAQLAGAGPFQTPVSPYMNINRLGSSPAVNWFTIVQPEIQFNQALGQLGMQQGNMAQTITGTLTGQTTGHPIMFNNYTHYYSMPMMRGGGMGGMGMGGMGGMRGMGMGGMGGMGMGGMGMGGGGMGGMGMGGMGMGGMGMGGGGMGGMGMGGMGGMGMGGMGMGGMGMYGR